jgi:hypothetical protein
MKSSRLGIMREERNAYRIFEGKPVFYLHFGRTDMSLILRRGVLGGSEVAELAHDCV